MNYCETCRCELTDQRHAFSGYGFYLNYCAACCPRTMDGWDCEEEHPVSPANAAPPLLAQLLLAIRDEPWEAWHSYARLALSDWLEENGDRARADAVRSMPARADYRIITTAARLLGGTLTLCGARGEVSVDVVSGEKVATYRLASNSICSLPALDVVPAGTADQSPRSNLTFQCGSPPPWMVTGLLQVCDRGGGAWRMLKFELSSDRIEPQTRRRCLSLFPDVLVPCRLVCVRCGGRGRITGSVSGVGSMALLGQPCVHCNTTGAVSVAVRADMLLPEPEEKT